MNKCVGKSYLPTCRIFLYSRKTPAAFLEHCSESHHLLTKGQYIIILIYTHADRDSVAEPCTEALLYDCKIAWNDKDKEMPGLTVQCLTLKSCNCKLPFLCPQFFLPFTDS